MKTNINTHARILSFSALACAILGIVLRCVNLFLFYETNTGYYYSGAILPVAGSCFIFASVLFFFVFSLVCFKKQSLENKGVSRARIYGIVPPVAAAFFMAFSEFASGEKGAFLSGALSIMTALWFICAVVDVSNIVKLISAVFAIIKIITVLASSYFNIKIGMNSPDKLLFELACAAALFFIACEVKATVGNPRYWMYLFSATAATVLCGAASVPSIIAYHFDILHKDINVYSEYYLLLGIAIYSGITLFSLLLGKKAKVEEILEETPASQEE